MANKKEGWKRNMEGRGLGLLSLSVRLFGNARCACCAFAIELIPVESLRITHNSRYAENPR